MNNMSYNNMINNDQTNELLSEINEKDKEIAN